MSNFPATFTALQRASQQLADIEREAIAIAYRLETAVAAGESGDLDKAKLMVEACIRDIRGAVAS